MSDPRKNEHEVAPQPVQEMKEPLDNEITNKDNLDNHEQIMNNSNRILSPLTNSTMDNVGSMM